MNQRILLAVILGIIAVTVFLVGRWLLKLPSKYDRKPAQISPWNSLDIGIDPSLGEGGKE